MVASRRGFLRKAAGTSIGIVGVSNIASSATAAPVMDPIEAEPIELEKGEDWSSSQIRDVQSSFTVNNEATRNGNNFVEAKTPANPLSGTLEAAINGGVVVKPTEEGELRVDVEGGHYEGTIDLRLSLDITDSAMFETGVGVFGLREAAGEGAYEPVSSRTGEACAIEDDYDSKSVLASNITAGEKYIVGITAYSRATGALDGWANAFAHHEFDKLTVELQSKSSSE